MKHAYTNEELQTAMNAAFRESSGDDGFWLGIARAFLDNLPEPQPPVVRRLHAAASRLQQHERRTHNEHTNQRILR
jgi:hypothetical protein